jgi:hypothetical protein
MQFKSYDKIEQIGKLHMFITQKLHGTNAQIYIEQMVNLQDEPIMFVAAGSRSRWLTPEDDNYGFAKFVHDNRDEIAAKLGPGRHFGEWCGPGINAGEGLSEKKLFLFNWHKFKDKELPDKIETVPVLYSGKFSFDAINETMEHLKVHGSRIVKGYMKPEGIVIQVGGQRYKRVFALEVVKWTGERKVRVPKNYPDVSHLLQPLRLEKLLSRDEALVRNYPESMKTIFSLYYQDLLDEGQITATEEELINIKKALGAHLYPFIKEQMKNV